RHCSLLLRASTLPKSEQTSGRVEKVASVPWGETSIPQWSLHPFYPGPLSCGWGSRGWGPSAQSSASVYALLPQRATPGQGA
ncbi:hypothetical protein ACJBSJ_10880, partial [Streptococcus suis]